MELCDLDLATYLDRQWSPVEMERTPIGMDQNRNMRMEQVWKIMMDVTSGLAFIHSHKEVHRDLKPRNSNSHGRKYWQYLLVLYHRKRISWKITDFGLTAEGTSHNPLTTLYSRGSASYRAPELLIQNEKRTYTNKVDVWALGCIFFEVVVRERAFSSDSVVQKYPQEVREGRLLDIAFDPSTVPDSARQTFISETIYSMLEIDPNQRPRASHLLENFKSSFQWVTSEPRFSIVATSVAPGKSLCLPSFLSIEQSLSRQGTVMPWGIGLTVSICLTAIHLYSVIFIPRSALAKISYHLAFLGILVWLTIWVFNSQYQVSS